MSPVDQRTLNWIVSCKLLSSKFRYKESEVKQVLWGGGGKLIMPSQTSSTVLPLLEKRELCITKLKNNNNNAILSTGLFKKEICNVDLERCIIKTVS